MAVKEGKILAIVSYLLIIGTIIAMILNNDKKNSFAAFHIRQALGLWLSYFVIGYMVSGFDSWNITVAYWIFFLVLLVYGLIGAINGKQVLVPFVGPLFQKVFKGIGK
jgi:uncharacterized membrane protein